MAEPILLDNDVVLKVSCYSLAEEMLASLTRGGTAPAMLGVGRYVVLGRLRRDARISDTQRASAAFARIAKSVTLLEPDENELTVASELEAEANRRDLDLDGGESQLLAILANRSCPLLLTGDKRAVIAIGMVACEMARGRIACLEQLLLHLVRLVGLDLVRPRICAEPDVDRAAAICFSCSRQQTASDEVLQALRSYISFLANQAPAALISGDDLSGAAL